MPRWKYTLCNKSTKAYDHYQQLRYGGFITSPVFLSSKFLGAEEDYAYMPNTVPLLCPSEDFQALGSYVHINYGAQVSPRKRRHEGGQLTPICR